MGVGEEGSFFCQAINVWSLDLRVSLQASDPIILIIDGNEKNIGFVLGRYKSKGEKSNQRRNIREHVNHLQAFQRATLIFMLMEISVKPRRLIGNESWQRNVLGLIGKGRIINQARIDSRRKVMLFLFFY